MNFRGFKKQKVPKHSTHEARTCSCPEQRCGVSEQQRRITFNFPEILTVLERSTYDDHSAATFHLAAASTVSTVIPGHCRCATFSQSDSRSLTFIIITLCSTLLKHPLCLIITHISLSVSVSRSELLQDLKNMLTFSTVKLNIYYDIIKHHEQNKNNK